MPAGFLFAASPGPPPAWWRLASGGENLLMDQAAENAQCHASGRRHPTIGDAVLFHDSKGRAQQALVTQVWGGPEGPLMPSLNVVVVSLDGARMDNCGRQIERYTSVCHGSVQRAHGYYWRYADEPANPYQPPAE